MFRLPSPRDIHRLVNKMDRSCIAGCWPWKGARNAADYGLFYLDGKVRMAHRVSLQWLGGVVLEPGRLACHKCDYPPCVNPAHLFSGTPLDNARDMVSKGRGVHGDRAWTSILNDVDRAFAFLMREQGRSVEDIADYFGLSKQALARELVLNKPDDFDHTELFAVDMDELAEQFY